MAKVLSILGYLSFNENWYVTMALAEFLSGAAKKRVLVIDLGGDETTGVLIGHDRRNEIDDENTVAWLIRSQPDPGDRRLDFDAMVRRGVSNVRQASTIDLLPSSQFRRAPDNERWSERGHDEHRINVLRRVVESHLEDYDVVLVECPRGHVDTPGTGILIRNALHVSDGYILPGDTLFAMVGGNPGVLEMPEIIAMIKKFNEEMDSHLRLYGMVVSGYVRGRRRFVKELLLGVGALGGMYWSPIALIPYLHMEPQPKKPLHARKARKYKRLEQKWGKKLTKIYTKFAEDILRFEGWEI